MNIQKLILATLAGFVGLFGLGYVIYVLLFHDMNFTTEAGAGATREYFPGIIAFEILFGLLLAIGATWSGVATFNAGMKKGALVGLLLGLCMGLWLYSTTTLYDVNIIWWEAITFAVRFTVAGGLVGWVLGRK